MVMITVNKKLVYSQHGRTGNHSLKLKWKEFLSDWRYSTLFILACSKAFRLRNCMMEVQLNYGIKLEHLIILALMSGNPLTLCLPLEFANKDSNCAAVSGVEILISSFCASLRTPIVHCQCWKLDLVCDCSYMQKSPSSAEAELTFPRKIFRGYKCLAGRYWNDAVHASGRACDSLLSLLVTSWTKWLASAY